MIFDDKDIELLLDYYVRNCKLKVDVEKKIVSLSLGTRFLHSKSCFF